MRRKQNSREEKQGEIAVHQQTWADSVDALAKREVYPPEEFAGFENFGEFPEWHPGQAECRVNGEAPELIVDSELCPTGKGGPQEAQKGQ